MNMFVLADPFQAKVGLTTIRTTDGEYTFEKPFNVPEGHGIGIRLTKDDAWAFSMSPAEVEEYRAKSVLTLPPMKDRVRLNGPSSPPSGT